MNKKILCFLIATCFSVACLAQGANPAASLSLPNIIPPSPEAAALGKYGQIPVDISTGIPSIDIPVYLIKTSRFQLPVSLSYHASGVKVDEIAPWTGLGWSLNAGGVVTRTVVGLNDDDYYGYLYHDIPQPGDLQTNSAMPYMDDVIKGQQDSEPDNFYYNFNGHSGKFIIGDNKKPLQIPITAIQIQMPNYNDQRNIVIKDEQGNNYIFGTYEYVTTGTYPSSIGHYCNSSWYLSQMISADHSDTIKFNYATEANLQYEYSYTFSQTLGAVYSGAGGICSNTGTQLGGITEVTGYRIYNPVRISSITYNGGKVTFISKPGRQDSPTTSLDSIIVFNYDYNAKVYNRLKSVKLNMDYFQAVTSTSDPINSLGQQAFYRLKLTGITESDLNNSQVQHYQFGYNATPLPPVNDFSQDIYGFYNGKITNQSLLLQQIGTPPTDTVKYNIGNADRSISPTHMMAGMLQTIQYPTGGYTNFIYEPAQSSVGIGGGIRVSAIKNYDSNSQLVSTKTYKYGTGESGLGILISTPDAIVPAQFNQQYVSSSNSELGVTTCPYFLRVFNSSSKYALSTLSGSPIVYPSVTEYTGNASQNIGKTIHQYDTYLDQDFQCTIFYLNGLMLTPYSWRNGQENYVGYYKTTGAGQYTLVSDKRTSYINVDSTQARGMKIGYVAVFPTPWVYVPAYYYAFNYPIMSGAKLPQQTIETEYDNTGINILQLKTTNYYYDNLVHLQPTRIVTTNSKGDLLQTTLSYPQDMVNNGNDLTGVYAGMSNANIISPVIESTEYKNTTQQLTDTKTNYFTFNGIFEPQTVQFSTLSNTPEVRLNFQQYDNNGNVLTVSKQGGPAVSYQWGYNKLYPVAQIINSSANNFFYEGFEDGNGNSTYGYAKSGNYSHNGPYQKTLSGLTNGSYILSYWQNTGSVWSFISSNITVSTGSYTVNLTSNIDDIRFYPANALMKTYTYNPTVGQSSMADEKNEITTFDYDSFQRLKDIKDKGLNIVKSYSYNYLNPQPGFTQETNYFNVTESGTFIRNNCPSGYLGSSITYTVPEGAFSSTISQDDANGLANATFVTSGQAYANNPVNCSCLPTVTFTINNTTSILGFQLQFTGPRTLTYNIPPSGSTTVQVPTGTYTLNVIPSGSTASYTYILGTRVAYAGPQPGATFINVNISAGSSDLTFSMH